MAKAKKSKPVKKRVPSPDRLTHKQRVFIDAYLGEANGNATEAARIAGYAIPKEQGYENLTKPHIRKAVDDRLAQSSMTSREVLARLTEIARGSLSDFLILEGNGSYRLDLGKAKAAGKLHLLKSIRPTRDGLAIELHDALAALGLLGKYHGLFNEKTPTPPPIDEDDDLRIPDEDDRPEPPPES